MIDPAIARPTVHVRPAEGEGDELVRFQRVMFWLRLLALVLIATQAPLYRILHPAILGVVIAIIVVELAVQGRLLASGLPTATLRNRSVVLLACDLATAYLVGTAFTADPQWVGFYFYPLMSLEATIIAGIWLGGLTTGLSLLVYLAQLVLFEQLGGRVEVKSVLSALSLLAMTGGFMSLYVHMARHGQRHLRILLDLTSALALRESEADALRHLDRRLHEATGGRVRTIVVREPGGGARVRRGHAGDERLIEPEALERAFGDLGTLGAVFLAGEAVTYEVEAWSLFAASLGLPDWARAVTLVPIFAEGEWIGILPVLWNTPTIPDRDRIRLLFGLADHMGLALARGELAQAREVATVDHLTGLLNGKAIVEAVDAYVARAERVGGRAAVVMVGIEGLGRLDGRRQGDATLREVSAAVRGSLRQGDVAGRLDEDCLLVVAADADDASAAALAARVSDAVRSVTGNDDLRLSIGTAVYPDDARTASALMDEADRALGAGPNPGTRGQRRAVAPEPNGERFGASTPAAAD